jgi:hypothetical protein
MAPATDDGVRRAARSRLVRGRLEDLYRELHAPPELSHQEVRAALRPIRPIVRRTRRVAPGAVAACPPVRAGRPSWGGRTAWLPRPAEQGCGRTTRRTTSGVSRPVGRPAQRSAAGPMAGSASHAVSGREVVARRPEGCGHDVTGLHEIVEGGVEMVRPYGERICGSVTWLHRAEAELARPLEALKKRMSVR